MPGTNLTQAEAAARSALLQITTYDVTLDLTTGPDTFVSTSRITFSATTPGASTFADLVGASNVTALLNGVALDPSAYADSRITLDDLAATNELVVTADMEYSHTGEGLHRFVDPVDQKVYLYSQMEVPDARRVFASFEQPDLKATFTFHVVAPEAWTVVSNSPTPTPTSLGGGTARWDFEATKRMSTYITAIIAGEYLGVEDKYVGKNGTIPLGLYCRASAREHMDVENLFQLTKQGFELFEDLFDFPYPFVKYDQFFVPEFNAGAMENAGAVTIRDEYIPASRQPRSFYDFRTNMILHEMAHQWFGDLVTMKWWNDLWLNESFAEWAGYYASANATEFTDAWTGFTNARKLSGYRQDQLITTHPIAPEIKDLHDIEVNFDMITYAKGASVLKQLVAWVGMEPFTVGLRAYFRDHAYGNTEFRDLLGALEQASGRDLSSWAEEWLQTSGVNTVRPEFTLNDDGTYASLRIHQSASPEHPTLRRHRMGIGMYDLVDGALVRRTSLEVDVEGEFTEISEAVGHRQPDLLLLNDDDLAYVKVRLDERSYATAVAHLSKLDDSLARALIWTAAWDMCRDGELATSDYIDLVLANIGQETDSWGLSRVPVLAESALFGYVPADQQAALQDRWEAGVRDLLVAAEPGSDAQLIFAKTYAAASDTARGSIHGCMRGEKTIADVKALLDGSWSLPGLTVDQDLRWRFITGLCAAGVFGEAEISAELERDTTQSGKENAAGARAASPDPAVKAEAWRLATMDPSTPNATGEAIANEFSRAGQPALEGYVQAYLDAAETILETIGTHRAARAMEYIFPRQLATQANLDLIDSWLATTTASALAVRYVREGRDELARGLRAQGS